MQIMKNESKLRAFKIPLLNKEILVQPSDQSIGLYILFGSILISLLAFVIFVPKKAEFDSALNIRNATASYFLYSERSEDLINLEKVNVMISPDFYIKPKFGSFISEIKVENLQVTSTPKIGQVKRYFPDETVVDINCVGFFMQECNSYQDSFSSQDEGSTFTYNVVRGNVDDLTEISAKNIKPSFNVHVLGVGVYNPDQKYTTSGKSIAELANVNPDQLDSTIEFDLVAKGLLNTSYRKHFVLNVDGDDVLRRTANVPLYSN